MTLARDTDAYSGARLRRALRHFVSGRVIGAVIGLSWLLLLVRALSPRDYSIYIALTGVMEIAILGTSVGLIAALERYVPDLRIRAGLPQVFLFVRQLVKFRIFTVVVFCSVLAFVPQSMNWMLRESLSSRIVWLFCFIFFVEAICRFLETSFDALLDQKKSQISLLFRNALRVSALGILLWKNEGKISLFEWMCIECVCAAFSLVLTLTLFSKSGAKAALLATAAGELRVSHDWRRVRGYAAPVYVAQFVGMLWSLDAAKILAARVMEGDRAAQFAFCVALAATVQRYLPTVLLMGLIRPLFVAAAHAADSSVRANYLFRLVLKLNVFSLSPFVIAAVVGGDGLVSLASGGRFDAAGFTMAGLFIYLAFVSIRTCHNLVLVTLEDGTTVLLALMAGLIIFYLTAVVVHMDSPFILISAMVLGEFVAIYIMRRGIKSNNSNALLPWLSLLKLFLAVLVSAGLTALAIDVDLLPDGRSWEIAILNCAIALVVYFGICYFCKPFEHTERESINRVLPAPIFFW